MIRCASALLVPSRDAGSTGMKVVEVLPAWAGHQIHIFEIYTAELQTKMNGEAKM